MSFSCRSHATVKVACVCRYKGVDRLVQALVDEWYADIKTNQIGAVVGGIGPLSAFTQLSK